MSSTRSALLLLSCASLLAACRDGEAPPPPKNDVPADPPPLLERPAVVAQPELAEPVENAAPVDDGAPWPRVISTCELAGCAIEVAFPAPLIDDVKTAPPPKVVVTPPEERGTAEWTSDRTLRFTPDEGSLNWGATVTLSFPDVDKSDAFTPLTVSVPQFVALGKVAQWPVVKGKPRFVAILNDYSQLIGGGALFALYDQPVSAKAILKKAKAASRSRERKLRAWRPKSVAQLTGESIDLRHVVAVKVDLEGASNGDPLVLSLPTFDDNGTAITLDSALTVQKSVELASAYLEYGADAKRAPLSTTVTLSFTSPLSPALLEKHLVITPKPRHAQVSAWRDANLQLTLAPGTTYRIGVTPGMTDILGNPFAVKEAIRFTTQDLPPQLSLPRAAIVVEQGRGRIPFSVRNVRALKGRLGPIDGPAAWITAQRAACTTPPDGVALDVPADLRRNDSITMELTLPAGRARAGLFCVHVDGEGVGSEANGAISASMPVQITDVGITSKVHEQGVLVWVTRLSSAAPIGGAKVEIYDARGARMATGTTADDGVVQLELGGIAQNVAGNAAIFVAARAGDDVAVAEVGPGRVAEPWLFGLPGTTSAPTPLPASFFTERGAYRPGESVHLKVIVGRDDGMPSVPAGKDVQLVVTDPRGQTALDKKLKLDDLATAHHELTLKEGADVGEWLARVTLGGRSVTTSFRVEEYRVPTFQVKLSVPEADKLWTPGKTASARVTATYLHGGGLAGRPVKVKVTRGAEAFAPQQFPGFIFGGDATAAPAGEVMNVEARLDGQGVYGFELPVTHTVAAGPMRYAIEAVVTDVDRQAYAGRTSRVVYPARFALGTKAPPRSIVTAGETLEVPIVAVATGGERSGDVLAGIKARARLERIDAHTTARATNSSVQLEGHDVVVTGETCTVKTKAGVARCRFAIPEPGRYRVRVWSKDRGGVDVHTGFEVYASGRGVVAWPRFDQERVDVFADKSCYAPGETATLIVSSPFPRATALLTLERAGVVTHRLVNIDGDTPALTVPLTDEHAPNVYASVVLLRGRVHDERDASGFETGAPAMRLGSTMLRVEPRERRVAVDVTTDRQVANPGSTVLVRVAAKDASGGPVANAQATVMVVDEAVLGLTGYATPDPMKTLYREQPLGVRTGESRLETLFAMRQRRDLLFPGGDGGDGLSLSDFPEDVRSLFKSTAYYNADVRLGSDGTAIVEVKIPDNVTAYRVMAVVIAPGARAGSAQTKLVSKKPLLVQAIAPRFVHPGDKLRIEALVFNASGKTGAVEVGARFDGMKIAGAPAKATVDVDDGKQGKVGWDVEVTGRETGVIRFVAKLGNLEDAVELKLPIRNPGTKRTLVAKATVVGKGGTSLDVPGDRVPGTTKVEVLASSTMLTELKDAVGYVMGYPNGCIEQTTSTAYPLVVLDDLLPEIGVEVNKEDLKKYRDAGIKRILSFQTTQGGLAYWPGSDEPHAFATAFGLTALIEAKRKGQYDVPDEALKKMGDYLEKALAKGSVTESIPHGSIADGDTRALFVMTLGRLGRPQHAWVETLWRERDKLTPFGLSFLATAVEEGSGNHALKEPILALIAERAKKSDDQAWYEYQQRGGYSMDSPLRTHAGAVLAFATGGASAPVAGQLVNGLLKRQRGGMWGNTQENVFGIMGIAAMARRAHGPGGKPPLVLEVNGRHAKDGELETLGERTRRFRLDEVGAGLSLSQPSKLVVVAESSKPSPINLRVRVEYDALLTPENRKPHANGFEIRRSVETLAGEPLEHALPLGDVVRVRLRVKAQRHANYVAIDDKLPAGLEPMNLALETTEKLSLGTMTPERERATNLLSYSEIRDHRVAFFIDDMPAGDYELVYLARATTPGHFLRPAASVEAMYETERNAASEIDEVDVK